MAAQATTADPLPDAGASRQRPKVVYLLVVTKPFFVVPLADLERGGREVEWRLTRSWLTHALEGTEAQAVGDGELELSLVRNGKEVLVRGRARARVTVPDARTLEPVELDLCPEIFLMLSPASTPVPRQRQPLGGRKAGKKQPASPRTGAGRGWAGDPELRGEDASRDTYSGEQVVLDDFVREFLVLEIPMVVHKDLPSEPATAIGPPPAVPQPETAGRVDPRLAPLAAIAERMRGHKD